MDKRTVYVVEAKEGNDWIAILPWIKPESAERMLELERRYHDDVRIVQYVPAED